MIQGSHPDLEWGGRARELLPNSTQSHVARGGREHGGQGGTATWKMLDVNHLAWAECGLQRGEEQQTGKRLWWAGGRRVGSGSGLAQRPLPSRLLQPRCLHSHGLACPTR